MWPSDRLERYRLSDPKPPYSLAPPPGQQSSHGSLAICGAAPGGSKASLQCNYGREFPMRKPQNAGPLLCPSAHSAAPGARLFGVQVRTESGDRQLAYLTETHPITEQVLELAGSAAPHEVLRVAAHCIEGQCPHWNGQGCRLATRVATILPPAVSAMPRCAIRPRVCGSSRKDPLPA